MHPKTLRVHPQQALAVYAESLASGSTFALFGDSSLGLAEQLVELGASSVQVWDPDARRAGAEAERSSDAITVRGYDASGPRTRSVNLAIIADLGLFDNPSEVLARGRDLVGDDGVLLVGAANRDVAKAGARAFEYYELFDLLAAHFTVVTMVAELPFHGVALVALGEDGESSGVSVDTQLAGDARVADRFLVVASQRDVAPQPYTVVELPRESEKDDDVESTSALRVQAARTEQVEALLRDRDSQVAELSSQVERLQAIAQAASVAATELQEVSRRAETTEARAMAFERELGQLSEANAVEIRRFEDILRERSQAARSLETELARRDQMVRELVDTLDEGVQALGPPSAPPPVSHPESDLSEENGRLRELLDSLALDVARREAEARGTAWTVSELERRLKRATSSAQPDGGLPAPDTNSR
jgi:hypothetical protein